MDQFKISIGPYELFSGFISGLPLLLSLHVWYFPLFDIKLLLGKILQNSSLVMVFLVIIISYMIGSLISGFTWAYFKTVYRVFRFMIKRKLGGIRHALLDGVEATASKISAEQFLALKFEDRLAYMVKRQYGSSKPDWALHRLKPFLREHSPAISIMADSYLAIHIMYRNLSFGFFVLALVLLRSVVMRGALLSEHVAYWLVVAIFSGAAFLRALSFSHWCDREILLGFYNVAIKRYLVMIDCFGQPEKEPAVVEDSSVEATNDRNANLKATEHLP